ncbi:serine hydrolase domain-containing protein [Streptomyces sp. H39-S7]|uniref:serine hydrolase domain-containing protein n=1 Tax=Streptomyces sp. H39-S7 TaxID=3004357 RepID=UPI0022B06632|nr:serine hydrolase domain-containing protein [Streptomyces sp. H39-S7]MCZ4119484.1 serine hydrolase [Streptomyces sp. H39-S7]
MSKLHLGRGVLGLTAALAVGATLLAGPATAAAPSPAPPSPAPRAAPGLHTGHAATQAALDSTVAAGVPGIQAQAQTGGDTWFGTAGTADLASGRPFRPGDQFRIGSITKTFVATVLLQLEAERKLSLDDTVDRLLPGVVRGNGNDGRHITLRQLLNHTSGLFNYTEDAGILAKMTGQGFLDHRYDTYRPEQLVAVALTHRPNFTPGTSWSYSNTNYIVAGMVVAKVTGHSYAQEIERRILRPVGLRSTSVPGTSPTLPGRHGRAYSQLFAQTPGKVYDVTGFNPSIAGSAGEMISTTADLNRFYSALLRGRLLPARQLAEMLTTVPTGPDSPEYGYGLALMSVRLPCGVTVWGHDGGIFGSVSAAVTTRDGRHSLSSNANADWVDGPSPVPAEYCPSSPVTALPTAPARTSAF